MGSWPAAAGGSASVWTASSWRALLASSPEGLGLCRLAAWASAAWASAEGALGDAFIMWGPCRGCAVPGAARGPQGHRATRGSGLGSGSLVELPRLRWASFLAPTCSRFPRAHRAASTRIRPLHLAGSLHGDQVDRQGWPDRCGAGQRHAELVSPPIAQRSTTSRPGAAPSELASLPCAGAS